MSRAKLPPEKSRQHLSCRLAPGTTDMIETFRKANKVKSMGKAVDLAFRTLLEILPEWPKK